MTPARTAYEASVARNPTRDDGTPRSSWDGLSEDARRVWINAAPPFHDAPQGRFVLIDVDGGETPCTRTGDAFRLGGGDGDLTGDDLFEMGYWGWREADPA